MTNDLNSIHRDIGRLEAKVDILLARSAAAELAHEIHEKRIAVLEHERTKQNAIVATVAAIAGFASSYIGKILGFT